MEYKYIARPCKNCEDNECCFKGHENNFEVCEDYTATNGDIIMAMFPNAIIEINELGDMVHVKYENHTCWVNYELDWWNAPYKE